MKRAWWGLLFACCVAACANLLGLDDYGESALAGPGGGGSGAGATTTSGGSGGIGGGGAGPTSGYPAMVLSDHPVVYFRFESNDLAEDSCGNVTASLQNPGAVQLLSGGQVGAAASITQTGGTGLGAGIAVTGSDVDVLSFVDKPFSLELWASVDTLSYAGPIVSAYDGSTSTYFLYLQYNGMVDTSATLSFDRQCGGQSTASMVLPADGSTFVHVVMVYSGGDIALYVNGTAVPGVACTAQLAPATSFLVGTCDMCGDAKLVVDEVAVYPSELSPTTIGRHYNCGIGMAGACDLQSPTLACALP